MIVKYVGKKIAKRHGCPVCGGRGRTEYKVAMANRYYLPSGKVYTFRLGQEMDLPENDAEFLLSLGDEFV